MKFILCFLILCFTATLNYAQRTIRVPQDYAKIQDALNNAQSGDIVSVNAGTYKENIIWPNKNGLTLTGISKDLTFIDGVNLASTIIINPLSANIDSTTIIKNITITNGGQTDKGGGLMIVNSSPKLSNVSISNNNSSLQGGGIYLKNSNAKINYCNINNNKASSNTGGVSEGAGVYIEGGSPSFLSIIVTENTSYRGAGFSLFNAIVKIDSATFSTNIAQQNGGAIYQTGNSNFTLMNSNVIGNRAPNLGGGICNYGGIALIDNTIIENNFSYNGGGIYDSFSSNKTTVKNSFIINQIGSVLGAAILSDHNLEVQNTVIAYNFANANANPNSEGGGICGKFHSNILINNSAFIGNSSKKQGGGLAVSENSNLTLQDCTFSDNNSLKGDGVYLKGLNNYNISNNNFIKNGNGLNNDDNTVYITATNNFWGHSSGSYNPNNNQSGLGDSTNYFVNTVPFLSSSNNLALPPPPTNLKVLTATSTSITLSWDSVPINNLSGYNVYFNALNSGRPYSYKVNVGNTTNYQLQNLSIGQSYYLVITTYDSNGKESWYSKEVTATPLPLAPSAPVAKEATSITQTGYNANWDAASRATGYYLDVATNNGFTSFVSGYNNKDVGNVTSYTITNLTPDTPHFYRVRANNAGGVSGNSNTINVILTSVEKKLLQIPTAFKLHQNYPNPFNPSTKIRFDVPKQTQVKLSIYDILGREVDVLLDKDMNPGIHEIIVDGSKLTSGVYFYKLRAGIFSQIKKFLLIK